MAESDLHPLTVEGLIQRNEGESPVLVLRDELERVLEIPIGLCEALAIQRALVHEDSGRPLTHALMLNIAVRLHASISRLVIDDYSNGTYYARLILNSPNGSLMLDCRPSDGIALALRVHAPIFASDLVMQGSA